MTPTEFFQLPDPVHLAEVRWWRVSSQPWSVTERRAIFYLHKVEWTEHPWGKSDPSGRPGAPFENQWALEERYHWPSKGESFHGTGRSSEGWRSLLTEGAKKCETESEAMAALAEALRRRIELAESDLADLRRMLSTATQPPAPAPGNQES